MSTGLELDVRHVDAGTHVLRVATLGSGPPYFLCLHGLADRLEIWRALAAPLATRGQVVLVDQRAHGESSAPPGPYRREDLAADVRVVLDRLHIDRAVLIGHSLGGIVAMTVALLHHERVAALVLLGTASECSAKAAAWYAKIARAAEEGGLAGFTRAIYGTPRELHGDARGLAHVTHCLESLVDDPLTPRLAAIASPTLLLVGAMDPMGPGASVIIQRQLAHVDLEIVPDEGHWLHVSAPERVLVALDRFLMPALVG